MEVAPDQVFEKLQQRAQSDPLVAEIMRTAVLEAAVDQLRLSLAAADEKDVPEEG